MDLLAQLNSGIAATKAVTLPNPTSFSKVVFAGVGGSAMSAEAIGMLWLEQPTHVIHSYQLPHWIYPVRGREGSQRDPASFGVKSDHLLVATSWSGETAETIGLLEQAIAKNVSTVVITSQTESSEAKLARQHNLPLIIIKSNITISRLAMPAMLAAQLTILGQSAILDGADEFTLGLVDKATNQAPALAQAIGDKLPLIYSSHAWRRLGFFWKIFINETTERHCFYQAIPGALHYEIAAVNSEAGKFCHLLLSDPSEAIETIQLDRLASWFEKLQLSVIRLEITGQNRLEKILYQYLLAEATSAILAGGEHKIPAAISDFKKFSAQSGSASGGK